VQEAGGDASAVDGGPLDLHGGTVCVSNGAIREPLMDVLNRVLAEGGV
jgi:myo-inositol-1(or 4)-monophosphatase